jgi:hypothetical protein
MVHTVVVKSILFCHTSEIGVVCVCVCGGGGGGGGKKR